VVPLSVGRLGSEGIGVILGSFSAKIKGRKVAPREQTLWQRPRFITV
jgi:hypothetical protein